jgi:hypothetical protein
MEKRFAAQQDFAQPVVRRNQIQTQLKRKKGKGI